MRIFNTSKELTEEENKRLSNIAYSFLLPEGYDNFFYSFYFIIPEKAAAVKHDLEKFNKEALLSENDYAAFKDHLFYVTIAQYARYEERKNHLEYEENAVSPFIFNDEFRNILCNFQEFESEFFTLMKTLSPCITNLENLIKNNKPIKVLEQYKKIQMILENEGIDLSLDEVHQEEIFKKSMLLYSDTFKRHNKRRKELKYPTKINPDKENNPVTQSVLCNRVSKMLSIKMEKYFEETGYLYTHLSKNLDLYVLGNLRIITYKNDEQLNMQLGSYNPKDKKFWIEAFGEDFSFNKINVNLNLPVVPYTAACPEEHLKEMIFRLSSLDNVDNFSLDLIAVQNLKEMGFDKPLEELSDIKQVLHTNSGRFYFKDPRMVEELNLPEDDEYKYYRTLRTKKTLKERQTYIKQLIASDKRNKAKIVTPQNNYGKSKSLKKKDIRLPYKDD